MEEGGAEMGGGDGACLLSGFLDEVLALYSIG